jgi:hypothetical protein
MEGKVETEEIPFFVVSDVQILDAEHAQETEEKLVVGAFVHLVDGEYDGLSAFPGEPAVGIHHVV